MEALEAQQRMWVEELGVLTAIKAEYGLESEEARFFLGCGLLEAYSTTSGVRYKLPEGLTLAEARRAARVIEGAQRGRKL